MTFEKVSFQQFKEAILNIGANKLGILEADLDAAIHAVYDNIQLPRRATADSAGYDFIYPYPAIALFPEEYVIIPTGIRWCGEDCHGKVLMMYPRSGLGFKRGIHLRNTVGIIDADYQNAANEGHIMLKVGTEELHTFEPHKGFAQGIIMPYYTIEGDEATAERTGGFGSTSS